MRKGPLAAAVMMLAVGLFVPVSAGAQAQWGEPINTPDRFVVLPSYNNQAVYDKETGLVWEQSPSTTQQNWAGAQSACNAKPVGKW